MHCDCPRDGTYLCASCQALLRRAQGQAPVACPEISERSFQGRLLRAARDLGYLVWHDYGNRGKNDAGFPDLVLLRPKSRDHLHGRLLFVELKSRTGKLTHEQHIWLEMLRTVQGIECYVWRPDNYDAILEILRNDSTV